MYVKCKICKIKKLTNKFHLFAYANEQLRRRFIQNETCDAFAISYFALYSRACPAAAVDKIHDAVVYRIITVCRHDPKQIFTLQ